MSRTLTSSARQVYLSKRTRGPAVGTSESGQIRKSSYQASAQSPNLFTLVTLCATLGLAVSLVEDPEQAAQVRKHWERRKAAQVRKHWERRKAAHVRQRSYVSKAVKARWSRATAEQRKAIFGRSPCGRGQEEAAHAYATSRIAQATRSGGGKVSAFNVSRLTGTCFMPATM